MRPIQNLHLRLLLPFTLVLVFATSLAWCTATYLLTQTLEQRLGEQMAHASAVLAEEGIPLTGDLLRRLSRLLEAEITLIGQDGEAAVSTIDGENGLREILARDGLQAMESGQPLKIRAGGTLFQLVGRPLSSTRDPRYRGVLLTASLADISRAGRQAALWLAVAALLGALALAWIGHRIVLGITRPVRQLSQMANRIAAGERDVRVEIAETNEIGMLADALNGMAQRLATYEQEIARRNRLAALGRIAARIAHEIRNPLTAIKLQLQLLAETLDGDARNTAEALLDEARRLELIVSGTLLEARQTPLALRPADINALVEEVTGLFRPQFAHHRIRLSTRLAEPMPETTLDADKFKQILVNLLVNAADALVDGGKILVETAQKQAQRELTLAVGDSGPGIPTGQRERIFSRATMDKSGGSGIGLSLSRELAEMHGGRIEIGDSILGGARILVIFPMETKTEK